MPIVLALAAHLGSCARLDVPPAPDLQPVLQAYEHPTVNVGSEIMAAVADEIEEAAKEIQDSKIFAEILAVIERVQQDLEMNTDENGNLVLGGSCDGGANDGNSCTDDADCPEGTCTGAVTFPSPNGAIRIDYICPGWDERQFDAGYDAEPDPANGSIDLWMELDSGGIGRVVWGTAAKCLYLVLPSEQEICGASGCSEASFDGGVALDLGEDVPPDQNIDQLLVTFVIEGTIGFDGTEVRINQSFRVRLADTVGLEILVDVGEAPLTETFSYFFEGTGQGVRDETGIIGCSLEERRCFDESGTLFSW